MVLSVPFFALNEKHDSFPTQICIRTLQASPSTRNSRRRSPPTLSVCRVAAAATNTSGAAFGRRSASVAPTRTGCSAIVSWPVAHATPTAVAPQPPPLSRPPSSSFRRRPRAARLRRRRRQVSERACWVFFSPPAARIRRRSAAFFFGPPHTCVSVSTMRNLPHNPRSSNTTARVDFLGCPIINYFHSHTPIIVYSHIELLIPI